MGIFDLIGLAAQRFGDGKGRERREARNANPYAYGDASRMDPEYLKQMQAQVAAGQQAQAAALAQQQQTMGLYANMAAGNGPSVAEQQMTAGNQQNMAQAVQMAGMNRGGNMGASVSAANQQQAYGTQQNNQAAGQLRAQEQQMAMAGMAQMSTGMRDQAQHQELAYQQAMQNAYGQQMGTDASYSLGRRAQNIELGLGIGEIGSKFAGTLIGSAGIPGMTDSDPRAKQEAFEAGKEVGSAMSLVGNTPMRVNDPIARKPPDMSPAAGKAQPRGKAPSTPQIPDMPDAATQFMQEQDGLYKRIEQMEAIVNAKSSRGEDVKAELAELERLSGYLKVGRAEYGVGVGRESGMQTTAPLPVSYKYKPGYEDGGAQRQYGVMATDLAKTPAGMSTLTVGPDGMLEVDQGKLTMLNAAEMGNLERRMQSLENRR